MVTASSLRKFSPFFINRSHIAECLKIRWVVDCGIGIMFHCLIILLICHMFLGHLETFIRLPLTLLSSLTSNWPKVRFMPRCRSLGELSNHKAFKKYITY